MEEKINNRELVQEYDVAIIGSGPAAFTAAIYVSRGNAKTLILGGGNWGGQLMLTTDVENYPGFESILGPELIEKMKNHATKFGAEFVPVDVEEVDFNPPAGGPFVLKAAGMEYKARAVIIATGAQTLWLGVKGEAGLIGRGVSSCAPCDAPFFKEKNVTVVGGGDSAMEEALTLGKYAKAVTVIHRRDSFRASKIMQDRVLSNPKIKVVWNTVIEEILGEAKVEGVSLKNIKTSELSKMPIDGVFVAIGHEPATKIFQGKLDLDEKGYIKKVRHDRFGDKIKMMTSVEGVFTAGDVHDHHYKQAITAAGFGCMAALDALAWLDEAKSST